MAEVAARKKGGGLGRKEGFGYMFYANIKNPFAETLDTVIQTVQFPPSGVIDGWWRTSKLHPRTIRAYS